MSPPIYDFYYYEFGYFNIYVHSRFLRGLL